MPGGVIEVRRRGPSGWLGWLGGSSWVRAVARRRRGAAARCGEPLVGGSPRRELPVLVDGEDGAPLCVACGLCEVVCPTSCLRVVPGERPSDPASRSPDRFDLDWARCLRCGLCEDACPERAIVLVDASVAPAFAGGQVCVEGVLSRDALRVPASRIDAVRHTSCPAPPYDVGRSEPAGEAA